MQLVNPSMQYRESWISALAEFDRENRSGFWSLVADPRNLPGLIQRLFEYSQGINIPEDFVPATTLWGIDKDEYIGHVNIRHRLNENLEKYGGHIGYAVRPSARGKGYGGQMLKFSIPFIKQLGLKQVLITCDKDNIASRKIIEKNGGIYENEILDDRGVIKMRYWIDL